MPKLQDTVIKKYNPSDVEAQKIKRTWIKTKKKYNKRMFKGKVFWITYNLFDDPRDKDPVIIMLNSNKEYILGFCPNRLNKVQKLRLTKMIIKNNIHHEDRYKVRKFFKRLLSLKFPREAFRVFKIKEIKNKRELDMYDFFKALSFNL